MHLSILPKTFTGKLTIGFFILFVATWTLVSILQPQFEIWNRVVQDKAIGLGFFSAT